MILPIQSVMVDLDQRVGKNNMTVTLPVLMSAAEVKQYLKCNNTTLYGLLKQRDFPSFRIGKKYYIDQEKFIAWMDKNQRVKKY